MKRFFTVSAISVSLYLAVGHEIQSGALASTAPICMGKMTQGKPGGDHQFIIEVPSEKVAGFIARGFTTTNCRVPNDFLTKVKPQMCNLAARSSPALDDEFRRMYSITPREICEL